MSLNNAEREGGAGASLGLAHAQVPRLVPGGYAAWRPVMEVHASARRSASIFVLMNAGFVAACTHLLVAPPLGRFAVPLSNKRTFTPQLQLTS